MSSKESEDLLLPIDVWRQSQELETPQIMFRTGDQSNEEDKLQIVSNASIKDTCVLNETSLSYKKIIRKRKRCKKGPIIYSDTESSEESTIGVIVKSDCTEVNSLKVGSKTKMTDLSYDTPRNSASTNNTSQKNNSNNDPPQKIDKNIEIHQNSKKKKNEILNTSSSSGEELDNSELEKSFYTCRKKLKISLSRFGAMRRKNYKYGPIIFSDDETKISGGLRHSKKTENDESTTVEQMKKPVAKSKKHSSVVTKILDEERKQFKGNQNSCDKTDAQNLQEKARVKTLTNNIVDETLGTKKLCERTEIPVGENAIKPLMHGDTKSKIDNQSRNNETCVCQPVILHDFAGDHQTFLKQSEKDSRITVDHDAHVDTARKKTLVKTSHGDVRSPKSESALCAMNELFFGDGDHKIKPPPGKRKIIAQSQEKHEVTLLDDNSLWSSPIKSNNFVLK